MKELEVGKTYYSIIISRSNLEVWIFKNLNECYLNYFTNKNNYTFDERIVFIKSHDTRKLNILERENGVGFEEESTAHENIKEFVGFVDFMKDYSGIKKNLLIKEIIE